jgi:phosphate-selective porin OprO/OprP
MRFTATRGVLIGAVGSGALFLMGGAPALAQSADVVPSAQAADERQAPAAAEEKQRGTRSAKVPFSWRRHPSLRLGDGTYIEFRARVQESLRRSAEPEDSPEVGNLDSARRRIGVQGEIAGVVEFQMERELGSRTPWRDVFVGYKPFVAVRLQAGKFKLPFSLDANTGAASLDFVNRSLAATHLAPGRDRGVMVHGRLLRRALTYEAGVFDHDGDNARTRNLQRVYGGRTVASRLSVEPFRTKKKSPLKSLVVGAALSGSELTDGRPALKGRTVMDAVFFGSDFPVSGGRRRTGLETRWTPGAFSVSAEYMRVRDERRGLSVENTDLSPLLASGWYASGTWALTGERKAGNLDAPRRPLFRGGVGAVELAGRIEALGFRSGATNGTPSTALRADVVLGNQDRAETLGVNWYPNRWVKLQVNVVHERLADPSQGPRPSQSGLWSRAVRLQFSL